MGNRNINNGNYGQGGYNQGNYNQGNINGYNENFQQGNIDGMNNYSENNYNQNSYSESNYNENVNSENNMGNGNLNNQVNNKMGSKEKNMAIAAGILLIVILLVVTGVIMSDGSNKDTNINENKTQDVQKFDASEDDLFNEIESQPGYEEDEKGKLGNEGESGNEDTESGQQGNEQGNGENVRQEATIDPQQLPNPDYNRQEDIPQMGDNVDGDNQSQGGEIVFQPKRYVIQTNSKKEIKIKLKGTPKTKVKGVYRYQEKNGEVKTKDWDKTLNDKGEDTLRIKIPHKTDMVELQILSVECRDSGIDADCIMESYETK